MPRPIPFTVHARWPERAPERFSSLIRTDSPEGCAIAMLGMPDDTGVKLNGGRVGAAEGPAAFRRALARYGAAAPPGRPWPIVYDAGDVPAAGREPKSIHETHDRIAEAAAAIHAQGLLPVGIGGGHDLTFPFVRALAERGEKLAGVYFDAHLDVRPQVGSGMPFRALLEKHPLDSLGVFGVNPLVNSAEHAAYFRERGGRVYREDALGPLLDAPGPDLFVSFDLDVLDAAFAPGVSAMNPAGWTPRQAEAAAFAAGRCARVRCFDIMELSPPNDDMDRTARLAAHLFLTFLRGFAERTA
ncbi:MAG TPA: arginase family protein [Phycisphaerales bacterium]|nr:arginase family protein [Phycisphaerales bacterium]